MENKYTIFYSWQSDISNNLNKNFIRKSLEKAIKRIKDKDIKIILDEATRKEPGSPNITDVIFKKIKKCDIFIADVSIINNSWVNRLLKNRPTPNPNVLIELGFAVSSIGWGRIICINNDKFGLPEILPFDIRQHRISNYSFKNQKTKAQSTEKLIGTFKIALSQIIKKYSELKLSHDGLDKNVHDIKIFKLFKQEIGGYDFKDTIESMANVNVISNDNHTWLKSIIIFFEKDDNEFIIEDLENLRCKLLSSLQEFKYNIGTRLNKKFEFTNNGDRIYYMEFKKEHDWHGSGYDDQIKNDEDIIYKSGMSVKDDYLNLRNNVRKILFI